VLIIHELDIVQQRVLYAAILVIARKVTGSRVRATEVAQEALTRLATTRPWTAERGVSPEVFVRGLVRSIYSHDVAKSERRGEREAQSAAELALVSDRGHSFEAVGLERAEAADAETFAAKCEAALREELAGYPLELAIVDGMRDDVVKPRDLVAHTGKSPYEVKQALARIRRYMIAIVAAERGEDLEVDR
jgi:hypothetical protein